MPGRAPGSDDHLIVDGRFALKVDDQKLFSFVFLKRGDDRFGELFNAGRGFGGRIMRLLG